MEIIVSENFSLTDAIKDAIHQKAERINQMLGSEAMVKVYLSKDSAKLFHVKMSSHVLKHDVISDATDEDFYSCLNSAKAKFLRQVSDLKSKKITSRH